MTRRLKDGIITNICKYCSETEIPSLYALWSGISVISAILGRKCCIEFGYEPVYPNTFIVLVAESGTCRKSSAIRVVKRFLKEVNPPVNLLSQKMTPEALIDALAGGKTEDDKVIMTAEGIAIAAELTTLIDRNSVKSGLVNVMTDLYDCDDFEYRTRGRGIEYIQNPCLSILGGTTIYWIKEALTASSITGGFTARIIFVYLAQRDKDVFWPHISKENLKRAEDIVHDMNEVAKIRGPFSLNDEAMKMFEEEYKSFNHNSELVHNPLTAGYASKRHINLLKVATVVSASRTDDREIDKGDMIVAVNALNSAEINLPRVMRSISTTEVGDLCQFVIDTVRQKKVITKGDLLKATRHKLTAAQLDDIMVGVCESGAVEADVRDSRKIYVWKGAE